MVIEQNDKNFTVTMKTPHCTHVNTFTIGKETEITAVDGKKFKVNLVDDTNILPWQM